MKRSKQEEDSPLIEAANDGNIEDVRILLLEEGMDVNQKGGGGFTALSCASCKGHTSVVGLF